MYATIKQTQFTVRQAAALAAIRARNDIQRFITRDEGQDFMEYAILAGAIGVVAVVVVPQFRTALLNLWQQALAGMAAAGGG